MAKSTQKSHESAWGTSRPRGSIRWIARTLVLLLVTVLPWQGCGRRPATPLEQAEVAIGRGEYRQALQLCDGVLQLTPDDPSGLVMRGRALVMLERWEDALDSFSRAIELRPEDYDSLYRREYVYKKLGMEELAMADQELAKSLDPTYKTAYAYEPGTFIRRPAPPPTPKSSSSDGESDKKSKDSVAKDDRRDNQSDDPRDLRSRRSQRIQEDDENTDTARSTREPSQRGMATEREERGTGTGTRRGIAGTESAPGGETRDPAEAPIGGPKRKPIGAVRAEPLTPPDKSWESDPEEAPEAPVRRPPISTALPVPTTEYNLQGPALRPSTIPTLPTTGLSHQPRPTSPLGSPFATQPQGPYTTGLPVQYPQLPSMPGRASGTPPMPMTTGLPHNAGAPGASIPSTRYSPIPGTATGPLSEYLNRLQPRSPVPTTGNPPISTSLPGSAPLVPTGVISAALPGSELPAAKSQTTAPISTALPESTSPPR